MHDPVPLLAHAPSPLLRELTRVPGPARGDAILVAVSGGADSVALLALLAALAPGRGWTVIAASLDHGLRGAAGAADVAFAGDLAASLGVAFVPGRADARPPRGTSPEEAARAVRRAFLLRAAAESGAAAIALGHTLDDQAETVLHRLGRGTGLAGAAAMSRWTAPFWRPLLDVRRVALRRFLAAAGQPWREDETNAGDGPVRNRIRHDLLPAFERCLGPGAVVALARSASLAADDAAFLEQAVDDSETGVLIDERPGRVTLDRRAVADLPRAVSRRILRRYCDRVTRSPRSIRAAHVAALDALARGTTGGTRADLPRGLTAQRKGRTLILHFSRAGADSE